MRFSRLKCAIARTFHNNMRPYPDRLSAKMEQKSAFYRMLWRWHFYAGLFVMPFIVMLSITGAIYLFKPEVQRWEERAFQGLPTANAVSPNAQADAALAAFPGSQLNSYRLAERTGDAVLIHLATPANGMVDVFVSPQGKVLGSLNAETRIMEVTSEIHSNLLTGQVGRWLVELAASWAIVMILTGLYLWWPAKDVGGRRGLAGVVWPRLIAGKRMFWRDLHAVTGFWVSGLALVLLLTGLPWTSVWGEAFQTVRSEMGWEKGKQDWTIGGKADSDHAEHDHDSMMQMQTNNVPLASLATIVAKAEREKLAFPVLVKPPSGESESMVWTVESKAQDRPLRATLKYDMATGAEISRENFADRHPIDRAIGYGVAWHEGQLFGVANQIIGIVTVAALIIMAVSGFIMWRKRKPASGLGAPPQPASTQKRVGMAVIILALAVFLPLLAISLVVLFLFDRLILPKLPRLAQWLQ
jgi:uncharacterized iron-regulated membrane protein